VIGLTSPKALGLQLGEGVDHRKVVEWTRRYGWPHVRVGRTIAFTDDDVEQIIAAHHVAGTKQHSADAIDGQTALSAARSA
jgi:hypothetical protein